MLITETRGLISAAVHASFFSGTSVMQQYISYFGDAVTALRTESVNNGAEKDAAKAVEISVVAQGSADSRKIYSSLQRSSAAGGRRPARKPAIYTPNSDQSKVFLRLARPEPTSTFDTIEGLVRIESLHIKYVTRSEVTIREQAKIIKTLSEELEEMTNQLVMQRHSENPETNLLRQIGKLQDALSMAHAEARKRNDEL